MSQINFYDQLIITINNKINNKQFSEALEVINDELTMPYIPSKIKSFLIAKKDFIEQKFTSEQKLKILSLEEVIKLIQRPTIDLVKKLDLVTYLKQFNLKTTLIYDFLQFDNCSSFLKLKILSLLNQQSEFKNLVVKLEQREVILSSDDLFNFDNKNFIIDSQKIEELLFKYPILLNVSLDILERYYFLEYINNKNVGNLYREVIFIVSKLFNELEIQKKILNVNFINLEIFQINLLKIMKLTKY